MKLSELKKGQKAIVKKVDCNEDLKQRFFSFGIIKGAEISVDEISFAKNTMAFDIEGTEIAIRIEEAQQIEVESV